MTNNTLAKVWTLIFAITLIASGSAFAQPKQELLVYKLNASSIIKGLPLKNHESLKSGNGRTKQMWDIAGVQYSRFEIIGDIQSDADQVDWSCHEYDKAGNSKSAVRDDSFCRKFFMQVLSKVLTQPEAAANDLLIKSKKIHPQTAAEKFGDFSIETDGEFYFIRRISRMH